MIRGQGQLDFPQPNYSIKGNHNRTDYGPLISGVRSTRKPMHMTTMSRPALPSDVPFLLRLRKQTMDAYLAASGANTTDEEHTKRLMYRFECGEILLQDGLPIGLLKVARDPNEWKVIQIQISPHLQGQGLGVQILKGVIEQARAAGAELVLSVLKVCPARALYERIGFVVEGEDDHEYFMRLHQGLA